MNEEIKKFWTRVDDVLRQKNITLFNLSKELKIPYDTIKTSRKNKSILKAPEIARISDYLSVSMDYLVKGRDNLNLSPEALLVESNLTYRQLIRGCEEIPELLPALTSLLQVGRKEEIEKPS